MSKNNSFRKAFYLLKGAKEYFDDTVREAPASIAGRCAKKYSEKLAFIERDFATCPQMPSDMIADFKEELNADTLYFDRLAELAVQLSVKQREILEHVLEELIAGGK